MDRNEFINRLFERAREKAGDAPDFACEACFGSDESFEVQVKNGEIYQYNVSGGGGLGFRVLLGGKRWRTLPWWRARTGSSCSRAASAIPS